MRLPLILIFSIVTSSVSISQNFNFEVEVRPVTFPNLPGLHSYAFGQYEGKWLFIGGRKDGLHSRNPNTSFPGSQNNTTIYVVDNLTQQIWQQSLLNLPQGIKEQLQATNMNFYQDGEHLIIIGGYAFSESSQGHITFPFATVVNVPNLIKAIKNEETLVGHFKQIEDERFAVTGGQLGKIGSTYYLVGGHRFNGRYNSMDGPSFTQSYTNQIRKFELDFTSESIQVSNYFEITDPIHLHRRDFNLVPWIFSENTEGYMISSGVFQLNADIPFLYPVFVTANGHQPNTEFNQYLSNYHGAKVSLYDADEEQMHALFFGGMSQFYYQNGQLIQDDLVPFVKTISRVSQNMSGEMTEYQLPQKMPGLQGASGEFIINKNLPHFENKVLKLNQIEEESFIIGHVFGGILSPSINPFANNQTSTTSADNSLFEIRLTRKVPTGIIPIEGKNPYEISVYPNPAQNTLNVRYQLNSTNNTHFILTNPAGRILSQGQFANQEGLNEHTIDLRNIGQAHMIFITVIFDNLHYVTRKVVRR